MPRKEIRPRAVLIVNTKARTGEVALAEARQRLQEAGVSLQAVHSLKNPEYLAHAVQESVKNGVEIVVVGGGDGSLRLAASILLHTETALGVLPLGTVNDFARNLSIEASIETACQVIAAGKTVCVDVGQANEDVFLITASLGFSAETQRTLSPGLKKALGPMGYFAASLIALRQLRHLQITVQSEHGEETLRVLQAGLINGHHWMGGAIQIPGVDLIKERLAFYALPPQSWTSFFRMARNLKQGYFFHTPGLRAFTTQELTIQTRRPQPLVLDGDLCGQTPARFRILPAALRVCVPESFLDTPPADKTAEGEL